MEKKNEFDNIFAPFCSFNHLNDCSHYAEANDDNDKQGNADKIRRFRFNSKPI